MLDTTDGHSDARFSVRKQIEKDERIYYAETIPVHLSDQPFAGTNTFAKKKPNL